MGPNKSRGPGTKAEGGDDAGSLMSGKLGGEGSAQGPGRVRQCSAPRRQPETPDKSRGSAAGPSQAARAPSPAGSRLGVGRAGPALLPMAGTSPDWTWGRVFRCPALCVFVTAMTIL